MANNPLSYSWMSECIPQAWVKFDSDGTIVDSYNVSSVSRSSTGVFVVNWDTDFASSDYCVAVTAMTSSYILNSVTAQSASSCTIQFIGGSATILGVSVVIGSAIDPDHAYVIAVGKS